MVITDAFLAVMGSYIWLKQIALHFKMLQMIFLRRTCRNGWDRFTSECQSCETAVGVTAPQGSSGEFLFGEIRNTVSGGLLLEYSSDNGSGGVRNMANILKSVTASWYPCSHMTMTNFFNHKAISLTTRPFL